ncbi:hypothetical protein [Stratiformator vulcanicus]|uniref:Uncharacterized protein n=1 Tax=Stratiformator vulcanicus TaxID=2527980 RepID=A0A517QW08_9PLAN|nr:hypothetical protein [Stratiformator vulcanicus]QDT35846.1 hypothetical protein Pan189_01990 [Stratiformator vulcanicus]
MESITLPCNECGQSLRVPVVAKFLRCNSCGAHLRVRREADVTIAESVDESGAGRGNPASAMINGAGRESPAGEAAPVDTHTDQASNPVASRFHAGGPVATADIQPPASVVSQVPDPQQPAFAPRVDKEIWREALIALDNDWDVEMQSLGGLDVSDSSLGGRSILAIWGIWAFFSALAIGIGFYLFSGFGVVAIAISVLLAIALATWLQQASAAWNESDHFRTAEKRYQQRREILLSKLNTP